jgi:hypothetical protein
MPGDLFLKEGTLATLEANGGSLTTLTAVDANDATLDLRAAGLSGAVQNVLFQLELVCQWATITSIVKDTVAVEAYAVPALDGTNYPDVDVTGGASALPPPTYLGNIVCVKAPTANTDMRFVSPLFSLPPFLYKVYLLNRSGQTISAGWTLKVMSARRQYS